MKRHSFVSLVLAVALAGTMAGHAAAAAPRYWNSGQTLAAEPKMNFIPNTDVYYVRNAPDFGLYRYADHWYLVDAGEWYRASSWRGPFLHVDVEGVPDEVMTIPESYQRHWAAVRPEDEGREVSDGALASDRTFTEKPKMSHITHNDVAYARRVLDVDLYRYHGRWYLVEGGVWYTSDSWRGPFLSMRARKVPRSVLNVPDEYRRHWTASASYRRRPMDARFWASGTTFEVQPQMALIPNTSVSYIRDDSDYDLYRCGGYWYLVDGGNWYRSATWRGPFSSIEMHDVPSDVLTVPYEYRRYWTKREPD